MSGGSIFRVSLRTFSMCFQPHSTIQRCTLSSSASKFNSLYFTKKHEWVLVESGVGTVGISDYAQQALGDIVYAQLPEKDDSVVRGEDCGTLESVKAASEIFSPVTGTIIEKNDVVEGSPSIINLSPQSEGWLFKVQLSDDSELKSLLSQNEYETYLKTQESKH